MNILILPNPTKKQSCEFAEKLKNELENDNFTVYSGQCPDGVIPDLAVIAGGDGTVLRYLDTVLTYSVPVLGINFGHRGYLTSCEPEDAKAKIAEISEGRCSYESRILFECSIRDKNGNVRECFSGINEAVISRGGLCRAVDFTLYINGNSVISFPADGIIAATPTGSTAYNFSANGPILMPGADNLVVTPICASSLLHSSLVTSGNDIIEIEMCGERAGDGDEKPILVADGYRKFEVDFDERIVIKRSENTMKLYGVGSGDFLRVLQQKMM